jgi:hypothetical protein
MELEPGVPGFVPTKEDRGVMVEPPPVRVIAVGDVILLTPAGHERFLDLLFLGALKFDPADVNDPRHRSRQGPAIGRVPAEAVRLPGKGPSVEAVKPGDRSYKSENVAVHYKVVEKLLPENLKLVQVEVREVGLEEVAQRLLERQIPYERVRGLNPGMVHLQIMDPAGHVVQVFEGRRMPL